MEEERRVRFTDEYVPGPNGCPVWGYELQKIQSTVLYVRAGTRLEAEKLIGEFLEDEENYEMVCEDRDNSEPTYDSTMWLHMDENQGWNK